MSKEGLNTKECKGCGEPCYWQWVKGKPQLMVANETGGWDIHDCPEYRNLVKQEEISRQNQLANQAEAVRKDKERRGYL